MTEEIKKSRAKVSKFDDLNLSILPLSDEAKYFTACDLLEELCDLEFESEIEENKRLDFIDALGTLVDAYEEKHFLLSKIKPTLSQIIEVAQEQLNLHRNGLDFLLDSKNISEILSGKKEFSLDQIRILH